MKNIKIFLKNNIFTRHLYYYLKLIKDRNVEKNLFGYTGAFRNRSKGSEHLIIVLAGYKKNLYEAVFGRLKEFSPNNYDVCVISSGKYSAYLDSLCERNCWSYLYTHENHVGLVQNIAIKKHGNAKYIYKIDEDIFLTEGYFEKILDSYERAKTNDYIPGIMAPLILINGYTTRILLKRLGLLEIFEIKFGELKCAAGIDRQVENNPNVAKFMWGDGGFVPLLDDINKLLSLDTQEESACPIRFSIGAILFERKLWEEMKYFDVDRRAKYMMGTDEIKICQYCMIKSRPIMVSHNTVVGHFSFGTQTSAMNEYFNNNKEKFLYNKLR